MHVCIHTNPHKIYVYLYVHTPTPTPTPTHLVLSLQELREDFLTEAPPVSVSVLLSSSKASKLRILPDTQGAHRYLQGSAGSWQP